MRDLLCVSPAAAPERIVFAGTTVRLEPLRAEAHGASLRTGTGGGDTAALWTWMPYGPFATPEAFDEHLRALASAEDKVFYAIVERATDRATGLASLMRIDRPNRVIEVGGIVFSPALQRTRGATEAMYLLARYVFEDLQYRRYEWKCNALNEASRRAAVRLGFSAEGLFRQHMIVKGRNRDTAWYSMLDSEWPARKAEFERWLNPANFDDAGSQKTPLRQFPD
jgi:RimJ/RimL family protein N-acetyltransferase